MDRLDGQLTRAATVAFADLIDSGYRLTCVHESGRGETVELAGPMVLITVGVDWLEGDLTVDLQAAGGKPVPLQHVLDLSRVRALHLHRLPRGVSTGVLTSTLSKVARVLQTQAADILEATPTGLARLGL